MDNFPGLFGDGELENLDLGGEAFNNQQGTAPAPYNADPNNSGPNSIQPHTNQVPSQPKMTMGSHTLQPNAPNMVAGYPNSQPAYQYIPRMQGQQYSQAGQYRPQSYPGQEMYAHRPPMQPSQNIPNWGGQSDPYSATSYQQPQVSYPTPRPPMNSNYPNQNIPVGAVNSGTMPNSIPQQNYQSMQPMSQGYTPGAQSIPYQGAPQPPYTGFDPQRPMVVSTTATSYSPGNPPQSYSLHPARPAYHMSQYPPSNNMGQQQAMMRIPAPNQDMSQYQGSHMPNGSPAYRASYPQASPQMSPHPQVSPRPQLSPMPRSMSPHAIPNHPTSSPVSSPAAIPPMSASPVSSNGSTSLQQLENMTKPAGAGRNTPTNLTCTTTAQQQHPLPSPGLYNTGVHSPLAPRGPISPGLVNRASINNPMSPSTTHPPMSPQHWQQQTRPIGHPVYTMQQGGFNQTMMRPPIQSSVTHPINTLPIQVQGSSEPQISDSIPSVSDSSIPNPSGSSVGLSNGPVTPTEMGVPVVTLQSDPQIKVSDSSQVTNGQMPSTENGQLNVSPIVPPSNVSPSGTSNIIVPYSVPQLTSSGNVPPSSLATVITTSVTTSTNIGSVSENGLPVNATVIGAATTAPIVGNNAMPGSPMPSANSPGNTMVRYNAPQGSRLPVSYSAQGYRMITPRGYPPQGQLMPASVVSNQMIAGSPQQPHGSIQSPAGMPSPTIIQPHLIQENSASLPQSPLTQEGVPPKQQHQVPQPDQKEEDSKSATDTSSKELPESNVQEPPATSIATNSPSVHQIGPPHIVTNGPLPHTNVMPQNLNQVCQMPSSAQTIGNQMIPTGAMQPNNQVRSVSVMNQHPGMVAQPRGPPMIAARPPIMPRQIGPSMPGQGARVIGMIVTTQGPPPPPMQLNLSIEIQQCQQQLQQLYKMPQNMQTQQQVCEQNIFLKIFNGNFYISVSKHYW